MRSKQKKEPESIIREIKRKTRRKFTSEEKIRIANKPLSSSSPHNSGFHTEYGIGY